MRVRDVGGARRVGGDVLARPHARHGLFSHTLSRKSLPTKLARPRRKPEAAGARRSAVGNTNVACYDYRLIKISMPRPPVQHALPLPATWGGRRPGAGRKLTPGRRPSVPHRTRPPHAAAHPLHVTLRTVA